MTSSSKLPVTISQIKYDVFVSFRGEDTRNFISHLDAAFRRNQITAFIDYQLTKGDEISPALVTAIEGSVISVVVFSEQYASSRWCLDELVKILECKNNYGQIVIPVFYHVDPSHVRKQTGIFGNSFSKLKERFQDKLDTKSWETNLKEAADINGIHVCDKRPEYGFLEEIIDNVVKRLSNKCGSHDIDHLIGVKSIITKLESLFRTAPTNVYTLGIWGIGGIGKTTIASAIFERISNDFEGSCIIENVREKEEKIGLDQLKQQLFSSLLGGENETIDLNKGISFYLRRLKRKKVVAVFDDVTRFDQIESLIESLDSFGDGSRIIITTRDRKVLDMANTIYEMKGLLPDDALTLFSQHGFRRNHPSIGFGDLSMQIISYCGGVPLALKVLGRLLFRREKKDWESQIKKLKNMPHQDILKVLKISYDNLDPHDKKIFLDIVCFFKGKSIDCAIERLDANDVSPGIAIKTLEEKCLIIISRNIITMHDLMEEMGKEIIRLESIDDPGKRSRLWHHEDIYKVLTCNMETKAIQGISFSMSNVKEIHFALSTFEKMRELRILEFYGGKNCKISHSPHPVFFKLRVLHWNQYPLESLPFHLQPEYLLSITLLKSKIKTLWDGNQNLRNLKRIDLSFSDQLVKLPDLKSARNLENLILIGCSSLVEIDLSDQLNKLVCFDARNCKSLKSLPPKIHSESLKYIDLSFCKQLEKLPDLKGSQNLENLILIGCSRLVEIDLSDQLNKLVRFIARNCESLKSLPPKIHSESLKYIDLSFCKQLEKLPDLKGSQNLENLILQGCSRLVEIDLSDQLNKLVCFNARNCESLKSLPPKIHSESLKYINLSFSKQLEKLPDLKGSQNLENLILQGCSRLVEIDLPDQLNKLVCVDVSSCESLKSLPPKILSKSLNYLCLSGCTNLMRVPDLICCNLQWLDLDRIGIEELPSSIECLSRLGSLNISNCWRLKQLPTSMCQLKSLLKLRLSDCPNLQLLPESLGHLEGLCKLDVERTPIRVVPSSIGSLQRLEVLKLRGCSITELPESLGQLASLQELCLSNCSKLARLRRRLVKRTPIRSLQSLTVLKLSGCPIEKLPESLGQLTSLQELCLSNCSKLQRFPSSIADLKNLRFLKISSCKSLGYLPGLPENIEILIADNCDSLEALRSEFSIFLAGQALSAPYAVVDLSNCFRLNQKGLSEIVKKVLQKIQHWETKWLKNAEIKGRKNPLRPWEGFYGKICYPGSEIPDWFDFQGMGSSGSVSLPRGSLQNNLIGVVVCAIVTLANTEYSESSESEDDEFDFCDDRWWCDWEVDTKCGQLRQGRWQAGILPDVVSDHVTISDHVTLCYKIDHSIFGKSFDESLYNNQVVIRFSTTRNDINGSMVKKWGIHFLYHQDSREFMKDFSSDEEEDDSNEGERESEEESNDEQERPHPKRWKLSVV